MKKKFFIIGMIFILTVVSIILYINREKPPMIVSGYIEANMTYISSEISGKIESISVTKGEKVKDGKLLISINNRPYKIKLQEIKQSTITAKEASENIKFGARKEKTDQIRANIERIKIQHDYLKKTYNRFKKLYKNSIISKQQLEQSKQEYNQSIARIKSQEASLLIAKLPARVHEIKQLDSKAKMAAYNEEYQEWLLKQTKITAPITGQIYDIYYRKGENIRAYEPILSIFNPLDARLIFYIPENKLLKIKIGDKIKVKLDPKTFINATINYVAQNAEYTPPMVFNTDFQNDLSFRVEAKLSNINNNSWKPGQPVSIILGE